MVAASARKCEMGKYFSHDQSLVPDKILQTC